MHFIFFLLSFLLLSSTTTTAGAAHSRRILHQPFFPQESSPASAPSPPPLSTSIPFIPTPTISSTTTPPTDKPFFPSVTSPPPPHPPPSPSSSVSFPANISSLDLPTSPKSKPISSKLIVITVSLVIAAAIVIAMVVVSRILKQRRHYHDSQLFTDEKTQRSYSSSRAVFDSTATGGGGGGGANSNYNRIPKLTRPSQTSSEFLYLGTLVNSHGGIDATNASDKIGDEDSKFEKLGSPELHPLPPLTGGYGDQKRYSQNNLRNVSYETSEVESSKDEEMEEFYSPRASIGTGSGSREAFPAVATDKYERRKIIGSGSSSSYSPSSLGSGSPARSVSLSISPPVSLSPIRPRPKSPDLVAIRTAPPPPSRPAPPPPPPPMPEPLIIPSPEVGLSKNSLESSPTLSNSSSQHNSPPPPARIPPPPPPPNHRKSPSPSPKTPTPAIRPQPLLKPPVLIPPTRHVTVSSDHTLISPIESLPGNQENLDFNEEAHKPKLKPLHWDKVRASSDREMVWDQIKSSSFILNEEMIETLFIVKTPNSSNSNETSTAKRPIFPSPTSHENRVLDPKKSQNIAISLRALNVTVEEVCEALLEGNADTLGTELLESLLKMAPTKEEERKLNEYRDDSPFKLGPAEKFLKAILDVPFAFKRLDAMLYISTFDSEADYLKSSFQTLEAACEELRNSRMFLKLLEAVLKTGNRMNIGTNRGDAQAFKLDTLLKLVDVKGTDGKTTLLHFVVQEIIRTEGQRLSNNHQKVNDDAKCRDLGLQVVSGLTSDLSNVKKAATMDSDVLNGDVTKLSKGISNILEVVRLNDLENVDSVKVKVKVNMRNFSESMNRFMKKAEEEIIKIQAQESVALSLVKEITEYFHGNSAKEEAHPFRIFMVVRDFLAVLDRVCKEVGAINDRIVISTAHKFPVPVNPTLPPVFNGFPARRQSNSSDEESSS